MKFDIQQHIDNLFDKTDDERQHQPYTDDRRRIHGEFQEEFELDCKERATDINNTFNTKID